MFWKMITALSFAWLIPASIVCAAGGFPAITDPAEAGPDFAVQGEYEGDLGGQKVGAQVIAQGSGKFHGVLYHGGLPGADWEPPQQKDEYDGLTEGDVTTFKGKDGTGKIRGGVLTLIDSSGGEVAELKKVARRSATIGMAPSAGAVVLFDGTSLDQFKGGQLTADGLLTVGTLKDGKVVRGDLVSKESFGDFTLHLEFRTPFMPTATGQARGNSGVYLQNRYECQVLDSFGLSGENNECGGFYKVKAPSVNMCFPPLAWQTYDIVFTAPQIDNENKKVKNARVTVRQNGVTIHEDLELPGLTPGGEKQEAVAGPFKLQDHGNPVMFRNIWVVKKS
jgi:hypothetical protein